MGAGIAQVAALAGNETLIFDTDTGRVTQAIGEVTASIGRLAERGKIAASDAAGAAERLTAARSLDALASADLAIEAIVESLDVKRTVFGQLAAVVKPDAILATNTSSLSIDAIAAAVTTPGRVVGMHFFNPAPVMKLVEVVYGSATAPSAVDEVCAIASAWGKIPVRVASSPGFIVNRVARPFYGEAHRLIEERAAEPAVIDAVMRDAGGFRMGPLELTDLIGQDVNLAVSASVWEATSYDPRYAPSAYQRGLVDAGRLGRKTGTGSRTADPSSVVEGPLQRPGFGLKVPFIQCGTPGLLAPLVDRLAAAGVDVRPTAGAGIELPSGGVVRLTDGRHATAHAAAAGRPVVLLDLALDYATVPRLAVAPSDGCPPEVLGEVTGLLGCAGIRTDVIDDAPGLVVMRTVARLVNEAVDVAGRGVATAADVDLAMRHGANYPAGPIEWGERIGTATVLEVLDNLEDTYRDGRYRPSPWLRRAAASGQRLA